MSIVPFVSARRGKYLSCNDVARVSNADEAAHVGHEVGSDATGRDTDAEKVSARCGSACNARPRSENATSMRCNECSIR